MILEGFISIKSALKAGNRQVNKVMVSNKKRTRKSSYMKKLCNELGVEVNFVNPEFLEGYNGNTHGGFIADVEPRTYSTVDEILEKGKYFWLDGVEDPYNFGSIIRTLFASGVRGLIIDSRDWTNVNAVITKASAGCFEKMNIAISNSSTETADVIKNKGFKIYATIKSDNSIDLYETDFAEEAVIVIGGERRGINSELLSLCDSEVHISYGREFGYSLPATIASSIISFELYRQVFEKETKNQ